jgi:hypothetical protein
MEVVLLFDDLQRPASYLAMPEIPTSKAGFGW